MAQRDNRSEEVRRLFFGFLVIYEKTGQNRDSLKTGQNRDRLSTGQNRELKTGQNRNFFKTGQNRNFLLLLLYLVIVGRLVGS